MYNSNDVDTSYTIKKTAVIYTRNSDNIYVQLIFFWHERDLEHPHRPTRTTITPIPEIQWDTNTNTNTGGGGYKGFRLLS